MFGQSSGIGFGSSQSQSQSFTFSTSTTSTSGGFGDISSSSNSLPVSGTSNTSTNLSTGFRPFGSESSGSAGFTGLSNASSTVSSSSVFGGFTNTNTSSTSNLFSFGGGVPSSIIGVATVSNATSSIQNSSEGSAPEISAFGAISSFVVASKPESASINAFGTSKPSSTNSFMNSSFSGTQMFGSGTQPYLSTAVSKSGRGNFGSAKFLFGQQSNPERTAVSSTSDFVAFGVPAPNSQQTQSTSLSDSVFVRSVDPTLNAQPEVSFSSGFSGSFASTPFSGFGSFEAQPEARAPSILSSSGLNASETIPKPFSGFGKTDSYSSSAASSSLSGFNSVATTAFSGFGNIASRPNAPTTSVLSSLGLGSVIVTSVPLSGFGNTESQPDVSAALDLTAQSIITSVPFSGLKNSSMQPPTIPKPTSASSSGFASAESQVGALPGPSSSGFGSFSGFRGNAASTEMLSTLLSSTVGLDSSTTSSAPSGSLFGASIITTQSSGPLLNMATTVSSSLPSSVQSSISSGFGSERVLSSSGTTTNVPPTFGFTGSFTSQPSDATIPTTDAKAPKVSLSAYSSAPNFSGVPSSSSDPLTSEVSTGMNKNTVSLSTFAKNTPKTSSPKTASATPASEHIQPSFGHWSTQAEQQQIVPTIEDNGRMLTRQSNVAVQWQHAAFPPEDNFWKYALNRDALHALSNRNLTDRQLSDLLSQDGALALRFNLHLLSYYAPPSSEGIDSFKKESNFSPREGLHPTSLPNNAAVPICLLLSEALNLDPFQCARFMCVAMARAEKSYNLGMPTMGRLWSPDVYLEKSSVLHATRTIYTSERLSMLLLFLELLRINYDETHPYFASVQRFLISLGDISKLLVKEAKDLMTTSLLGCIDAERAIDRCVARLHWKAGARYFCEQHSEVFRTLRIDELNQILNCILVMLHGNRKSSDQAQFDERETVLGLIELLDTAIKLKGIVVQLFQYPGSSSNSDLQRFVYCIVAITIESLQLEKIQQDIPQAIKHFLVKVSKTQLIELHLKISYLASKAVFCMPLGLSWGCLLKLVRGLHKDDVDEWLGSRDTDLIVNNINSKALDVLEQMEGSLLAVDSMRETYIKMHFLLEKSRELSIFSSADSFKKTIYADIFSSVIYAVLRILYVGTDEESKDSLHNLVYKRLFEPFVPDKLGLSNIEFVLTFASLIAQVNRGQITLCQHFWADPEDEAKYALRGAIEIFSVNPSPLLELLSSSIVDSFTASEAYDLLQKRRSVVIYLPMDLRGVLWDWDKGTVKLLRPHKCPQSGATLPISSCGTVVQMSQVSVLVKFDKPYSMWVSILDMLISAVQDTSLVKLKCVTLATDVIRLIVQHSQVSLFKLERHLMEWGIRDLFAMLNMEDIGEKFAESKNFSMFDLLQMTNSELIQKGFSTVHQCHEMRRLAAVSSFPIKDGSINFPRQLVDILRQVLSVLLALLIQDTTVNLRDEPTASSYRCLATTLGLVGSLLKLGGKWSTEILGVFIMEMNMGDEQWGEAPNMLRSIRQVITFVESPQYQYEVAIAMLNIIDPIIHHICASRPLLCGNALFKSPEKREKYRVSEFELGKKLAEARYPIGALALKVLFKGSGDKGLDKEECVRRCRSSTGSSIALGDSANFVSIELLKLANFIEGTADFLITIEEARLARYFSSYTLDLLAMFCTWKWVSECDRQCLLLLCMRSIRVALEAPPLLSKSGSVEPEDDIGQTVCTRIAKDPILREVIIEGGILFSASAAYEQILGGEEAYEEPPGSLSEVFTRDMVLPMDLDTDKRLRPTEYSLLPVDFSMGFGKISSSFDTALMEALAVESLGVFEFCMQMSLCLRSQGNPIGPDLCAFFATSLCEPPDIFSDHDSFSPTFRRGVSLPVDVSRRAMASVPSRALLAISFLDTMVLTPYSEALRVVSAGILTSLTLCLGPPDPMTGEGAGLPLINLLGQCNVAALGELIFRKIELEREEMKLRVSLAVLFSTIARLQPSFIGTMLISMEDDVDSIVEKFIRLLEVCDESVEGSSLYLHVFEIFHALWVSRSLITLSKIVDELAGKERFWQLLLRPLEHSMKHATDVDFKSYINKVSTISILLKTVIMELKQVQRVHREEANSNSHKDSMQQENLHRSRPSRLKSVLSNFFPGRLSIWLDEYLQFSYEAVVYDNAQAESQKAKLDLKPFMQSSIEENGKVVYEYDIRRLAGRLGIWFSEDIPSLSPAEDLPLIRAVRAVNRCSRLENVQRKLIYAVRDFVDVCMLIFPQENSLKDSQNEDRIASILNLAQRLADEKRTAEPVLIVTTEMAAVLASLLYNEINMQKGRAGEQYLSKQPEPSFSIDTSCCERLLISVAKIMDQQFPLLTSQIEILTDSSGCTFVSELSILIRIRMFSAALSIFNLIAFSNFSNAFRIDSSCLHSVFRHACNSLKVIPLLLPSEDAEIFGSDRNSMCILFDVCVGILIGVQELTVSDYFRIDASAWEDYVKDEKIFKRLVLHFRTNSEIAVGSYTYEHTGNRYKLSSSIESTGPHKYRTDVEAIRRVKLVLSFFASIACDSPFGSEFLREGILDAIRSNPLILYLSKMFEMTERIGTSRQGIVFGNPPRGYTYLGYESDHWACWKLVLQCCASMAQTPRGVHQVLIFIQLYRNLIVGSMQRGQELTISLLEERRLSLDIYALLLSSGHAWRARYSDLYNSLCKCVYGSMVECAVLLGDGSHLALGIKSGSVQHRAIQHQDVLCAVVTAVSPAEQSHLRDKETQAVVPYKQENRPLSPQKGLPNLQLNGRVEALLAYSASAAIQSIASSAKSSVTFLSEEEAGNILLNTGTRVLVQCKVFEKDMNDFEHHTEKKFRGVIKQELQNGLYQVEVRGKGIIFVPKENVMAVIETDVPNFAYVPASQLGVPLDPSLGVGDPSILAQPSIGHLLMLCEYAILALLDVERLSQDTDERLLEGRELGLMQAIHGNICHYQGSLATLLESSAWLLATAILEYENSSLIETTTRDVVNKELYYLFTVMLPTRTTDSSNGAIWNHVDSDFINHIKEMLASQLDKVAAEEALLSAAKTARGVASSNRRGSVLRHRHITTVEPSSTLHSPQCELKIH